MISIKRSGTIQQAAGRHRQAITATYLYKAVVGGGGSNRVQNRQQGEKYCNYTIIYLANTIEQSTSC